MLKVIVYTSEFTGSDSEISSVLLDVTTVAKRKNKISELTGVLFYHNGRFLQVLEGMSKHLEELMETLKLDSRHSGIERIIDEAIEERGFPNWNMDSFNLSDIDTIDKNELKQIRDAYKSNFQMRSDVITLFYKEMLKKHTIRDIKD